MLPDLAPIGPKLRLIIKPAVCKDQGLNSLKANVIKDPFLLSQVYMYQVLVRKLQISTSKKIGKSWYSFWSYEGVDFAPPQETIIKYSGNAPSNSFYCSCGLIRDFLQEGTGCSLWVTSERDEQNRHLVTYLSRTSCSSDVGKAHTRYYVSAVILFTSLC